MHLNHLNNKNINLTKEFENKIETINEEKNLTISKLEKIINEQKESINIKDKRLSELEENITKLSKDLNDVKSCISSYEQKAISAEEKYNNLSKILENEYNEKSKLLENEYEKRTLMFKNTQLESINQIKKDFQELISLKDKQNRIMAEKYKELKEIFDKRPSREEDLENISNLMDELKRNEKIIKNFEGKLEFYKNELDIREENYNGKFNYKPNVGNYDPLKGKEQFNNNSLNRMNYSI